MALAGTQSGISCKRERERESESEADGGERGTEGELERESEADGEERGTERETYRERHPRTDIKDIKKRYAHNEKERHTHAHT